MYKVTAEAAGYNCIEFVFENMFEASEFIQIALKNAVSVGFKFTVVEYVPVSDISQEISQEISQGISQE